MKVWVIFDDDDYIHGYTTNPANAFNYMKNYLNDTVDMNKFERMEKLEKAFVENNKCFGVDGMIYAELIPEIKG